jgi:acid stress-induced BolA-like protein IbaG/YrbA
MNLIEALTQAIESGIPGAKAEVTGGGGHFNLVVTSKQFEGKGTLDKQRLVYSAISELMKGDNAPVHAIDSIVTKVE